SAAIIFTSDLASLRFGTTDFTIDFWVYYNSGGINQVIYDKGYKAAGGFVLETTTDAAPKIQVYCNGSAVAVETICTATGGSWTHKAIVRSGTTVTIYSNGTSNGSGTCSADLNSTATIAIGAQYNPFKGNPMDGNLDEFRVSNVARWTGNFTPPAS